MCRGHPPAAANGFKGEPKLQAIQRPHPRSYQPLRFLGSSGCAPWCYDYTRRLAVVHVLYYHVSAVTLTNHVAAMMDIMNIVAQPIGLLWHRGIKHTIRQTRSPHPKLATNGNTISHHSESLLRDCMWAISFPCIDPSMHQCISCA